MDQYRAYLLPGIGALVLLGYYAWTTLSDEGPAAPATASKTVSAPADRPTEAPSAAPPAHAAPPGSATPPAAAPRAAAVDRARDRAKRDALRERIQDAQRKRLDAAQPGDDGSDDPPPTGQLDPKYIQSRIQEDLVPLATECYQMALEDDEALEGRLVIQFSIVGEPDVGGIVETAEASAESDIVHEDLVECMRESMMSVSFDPPQDGGTLSVSYPFVFEPETP